MNTIPYTAKCRYADQDKIEVGVYEDDGEVRLRATGGSLYLTPADARKLAKAIKKAAKIAEASE